METVLVVTLAHLWPGSGFDILVIDAEGAEAKILSMPLPQPLPRLVLFEIANLKASQLAAINSSLVAQGYEHVHDLHHQDAWAVAHGLPPQDRLYGIPLRFDRLSPCVDPPLLYRCPPFWMNWCLWAKQPFSQMEYSRSIAETVRQTAARLSILPDGTGQ